MTGVNGLVTRISAQPLLLGQLFASAAGALAMVMAAAAMEPEHFTTFSLYILVTFIVAGAVRALLFLPALIETRTNRHAHVHIGVALSGSLAAMVCFAVAAVIMGVRQPGWLLALSAANALPVLSEWLRMRGTALDERWNVARSDALRLTATLSGPVVLWWTTAPEVFFLFVSITYLSNIIYLAARLPAVAAHLSPTRFWRQASSVLADFLIGQLVASIPLILLGGLGDSLYIGGVRLAQTLLGPLNLFMAATWTNLLADGATRETHADPRDLIRHGRRASRNLSLLSLVVVPSALLALTVTGFSLRGADNHSLIVGTLLVGGLAITSGYAGVDAMVLRLLGHPVTATVGRALLVALASGGYVVGYVVGGVDGSLIGGFACAAIGNPLAFVLPAAVIYRRYRKRDRATVEVG